jgi:tetratricopeptide (TPR) repeat protein
MGRERARQPAKLLSDEMLERLGLEFEIGFCEMVLVSDPHNLAALESLGNAYTRSGRVRDGLEVDRRLVALLPESAIAHYNLACSLSLLGQVDASLEALERAVRLGYRDFDYLERDPDLDNVRRDGRYKAIIKAKR